MSQYEMLEVYAHETKSLSMQDIAAVSAVVFSSILGIVACVFVMSVTVWGV